jgi:FkbM family methyltransferase
MQQDNLPETLADDAAAEQKPLPSTPDEVKAMMRRHKRNLRRSWADGYLLAVCAMLKPGDLALDLGANMGDIAARLVATGADVIAYEPDPLTFDKLKHRFAGVGNITLVNAAVGVGAGTAELMRADNFAANPSGASVKSTILGGGRGMDSGNIVQVPLLDFPTLIKDFALARGEVAFVKMDIEGAELDILETMHRDKLFASVRCLVAETHERKFKDLRERYRVLRADIAANYHPGRVNLDWI